MKKQIFFALALLFALAIFLVLRFPISKKSSRIETINYSDNNISLSYSSDIILQVHESRPEGGAPSKEYEFSKFTDKANNLVSSNLLNIKTAQISDSELDDCASSSACSSFISELNLCLNNYMVNKPQNAISPEKISINGTDWDMCNVDMYGMRSVLFHRTADVAALIELDWAGNEDFGFTNSEIDPAILDIIGSVKISDSPTK